MDLTKIINTVLLIATVWILGNDIFTIGSGGALFPALLDDPLLLLTVPGYFMTKEAKDELD